MNDHLIPGLIILIGVITATVNFMFPFLISSLVIIASVFAAYSVIKANQS